MRSSSFVPLSLLALLACSAAPEAPIAPVVVASASASAAPTAEPAEVAFVPTLPHGAALAASLDLAPVDAHFADVVAAMSPIFARSIGLDPAELAGGLRSLGIDTSRPALLAVIGPQEDELRAIASLPKPSRTNPAPEALSAMRSAAASLVAPLALRIILPVTNAKVTKGLLTGLLEKEKFVAHPGGVYIRSKELVALGGDDRSLSIDLVIGNDVNAGLAALRADAAKSAASDVPALEGRVFRAVYSPRALAVHGIVNGLVRTVDALSGGSIDASQAVRIANYGLMESMEWKKITESARGPYMERVDLGLVRHDTKGEIDVRIETGAGWTFGADDIWKPSPSIRVDGAKTTLDVSTKFLDALPAPPPDAGDQRTPFQQFARDAREAGTALPVIAPHLLLLALREPFDHLAFSAPLSKLGFDRLGIYATDLNQVIEHPAFFGVLPDKTSRAAAECVLAGKSPCAAKSKLKLDATVQIDHAFARLTRAGDRFVVLLADDKKAVAVKVEPVVAGPAIADAMIGAFVAGMPGLPASARAIDHVQASVERDGKTILLRAQTL